MITRRRVTAPLLALLVAALAVLAPQTCLACSCIVLTTAEKVDLAPAIFTGTVLDRRDSNEGGDVASDDVIAHTVQVSTVHKGEVTAQTQVFTARDSAACGVNLEVGTEYVFFLDQGSTGSVSLCGGTAERPAFSDADLAALGEGSTPIPGASGTTADETSAAGTDGNRALRWGMGGVGLTAVAMMTVIWWPRRGS